MKIILFLISFFLLSCGDADNNDVNTSDSMELENPADVQPPSDAIPDSMQIINDSVIQPDHSGQGPTNQATRHDSL